MKTSGAFVNRSSCLLTKICDTFCNCFTSLWISVSCTRKSGCGSQWLRGIENGLGIAFFDRFR